MLLDEIVYRRAEPEDALALARFGSEAFVAAYGQSVRPADLALHVLRTYSEELQLAELTDPACWTLVAQHGGELVGAALLRAAPPPAELAPELRWSEVARFYLARSYWRTGVSGGLMTAVLRSIRERPCEVVWLQVWEAAEAALRFYRKWGFYEVGDTPFRVGTDIQRDLLMARSLGSLPDDS